MNIIKSKSRSKYKKIWKDLRQFNLRNNKFLSCPKAYKRRPHNFYAYDGKKLIGGALCETRYNWLYIDVLKVSEDYRGQEIGTALIQKVENFAREQYMEGVYLETFDFQARPFYEKMGFTLCGKVEDLPPKSCMYILSKKLK